MIEVPEVVTDAQCAFHGCRAKQVPGKLPEQLSGTTEITEKIEYTAGDR